MDLHNKRGLVSVVFVLLLVGCNPCNDTDQVIQNVNDHAFAGPEMTVVTFNLLHGFGDAVNDATLDDRLNLVAEEVAGTLPDVVLFQEASVTMPQAHCNVIETLAGLVNTALEGQTESYNSIYARANGSADLIGFEEGSAVLSLHEILASDVYIYTHNPSTLPESRIALRATLRGGTRDIDVFATHLTNREDTVGSELVRTLQARELAQEIIPGRGNTNPVVVGGDFNDPPGTATIVEMTDAGGVDIFATANPGELGYTSFGHPFDITDPTEEPQKRIDYLFMFDAGGLIAGSERFLDTARDIDPGPGESWLWASDHVGVKATLRPSTY
jgi:endonuclease/exonuclease/phosphatase family metal-dependent hydrolase